MYRELIDLLESDIYPFHMPGHKRCFRDPYLGTAMGLDITEIDGFDNLHEPKGLIKKLQHRMAAVFKADNARLLINGSTSGVLASISAAVPEGRKLLLARNSHKSAYNALFLNDLEGVYIIPKIIPSINLNGGIEPSRVKEVLSKDPSIGAVFITSPTYEGVVSDISEIAGISHSFGVPLIVDSAHGAHFGLYEPFTEAYNCPSAFEAGADIVIESLHKTLPCFTQTAMVLYREGFIDTELFLYYYSLFQTTSPSYLFMAGVDRCLDFLESEGENRFLWLEKNLRSVRERAESYLKVSIPGIDLIGEHGVFGFDPTKLLISRCGMKGQAVYDYLKGRFHLQPEMASESCCLLMSSIMDTEEGFTRLKEALEGLDSRDPEEAQGSKDSPDKEDSSGKGGISSFIPGDKAGFCSNEFNVNKAPLRIREAMGRKCIWLPLESCLGRVSRGFIYAYPPDIPLMVPGEEISFDTVKALSRLQNSGIRLYGIEDGRIAVID